MGLKVCEGRLHKGDFAKMEPGDVIIFTNQELGFHREYSVIITRLSSYNTFENYLRKETIKRCLPGINNMRDGLSVYYKYFSKEDEEKYGIVAIEFELL